MKTYLLAILVLICLHGTAVGQMDAGVAAVEPVAPSEVTPAPVPPVPPATAVEAAPASTQPSTAAAPVPPVKGAPDPEGNLMDGAKLALENGGWVGVLGFLLAVLVTRFTRPMAGKVVGWFNTRWGGYTWSIVAAMAGTIGTALSMGVPFSLGLLGTGMTAAMASIAVHQSAKDLKAK